MPSHRLPSLFRWAASDGVVQTVEFHIRRGDDVNARDSRGRTPLLLAAAGGHFEVCQLLIKAGADPSLVDWEGNDALSVAIKERQEDAAAVLRACRPSESAESASSVVVDDPFAGVADVERVWDEESLDLADWEEVADSSPPVDDPSVYSSVRELQDQISKHVPTNQDDDWSDVEVDLPDDTDWYATGDAAWLDDVRTLIRAGLSCGWVTAYEVAELAWNGEDDQYDIGTESRLRVMMEAIGILVEDDPGAPVSASIAWPQSDVILDDSDEEMVQDAIAFLGDLSRNQDLLIPYSKDLNGARRLSADEEVALATRIEDATDEVFRAISQSTEASHQLFEWVDQLENSIETDPELSTDDSGGDEEFDSGEGQDSDRPSLTPSMSHNLTGSQAIRHLMNGSSLGARDTHRADTFRDGLSALRLSGVAIRHLCATVTENASNPELNRILTSALRAREKASAEFVEANLRLVLWCAKRQGGLPLMDRVQEGSIGLLKAVERFDPRLGFRFSTYATWWIRQAISRAVADQGRIIRLPVHAVERLAKVQRAAGAASALTGRPPDASELASEFGVSGRELEKTLLLRQDAELVENVVDWSPAMDTPLTAEADFASRFAIRHDIDFALRFLTERQAYVIRFRFGLGGGPDHTLQQVGDKLNLTRERVRQIEVAALKTLHRVLSTRYGTGGKRVS